jgi:hypothetical protein
MGVMEKILEDYVNAVEGKDIDGVPISVLTPEIYSKGKLPPEPGDVYEIPTRTLPIYLLVIKTDDHFSDVVPINSLVELASKRDFLLSFPHPERDVWMAELDLLFTIPNYILAQAGYAGSLGEDIHLIKEILAGENKIPEGRRGFGYKEVQKLFKKIESERIKPLVEETFKVVMNVEVPTIVLLPHVRSILESEGKLRFAASAESRIISNRYGDVLFNQEKSEITIVFKDEFKGKEGVVSLETQKKGKVVLYYGILQTLVIQGISPEIFRSMEFLHVETVE